MIEPLVPYPELTRRYIALKSKDSKPRLEVAKSTSSDEIAAEFIASVKAFEAFSTQDAFFDDRDDRDQGQDDKSGARTYGWAMAMKNTQVIEVDGAPELNFRYVEREISPTRTERRGRFQVSADDEPGMDGHHVLVDLVLANDHSHRPIIAELKIGSDKDPYTGLLQALAAAAQFVPEDQRQRLARLRRAPANFGSVPLVDVYVLLAGFPDDGRHRFEQLDCAIALARNLESHPSLQGLLGRLRILQVSGRDTGTVTATTELPRRRSVRGQPPPG